jgi:4-hydroxy-tetrahydrodipicolinate synthase
MSASAKPNRYLGGGKARMLLHGILPVLQVPFGSDGEIVEAELRREVTFCIAARADGLVVPALASEFMVLTDEERRRVVEIVADEAAGRVPVIAGVAAPSIQGAAAFARHARQAGAAAVMALPPYIRKQGADGIIAYYAAIADAAKLPIVVQNAPPPFAAGIGLDLLLRLIREVPLIQYIKEERPPASHHISALIQATPARPIGIFGGTAGLYLVNELARGATGCMPSAAVPDVLVAIMEAFAARRVADARKVYNCVLPLLNLEMSVQMVISKEVLRRRGVFSGSRMRDPEFPGIDAGDLKELDAIWPSLEQHFAAATHA